MPKAGTAYIKVEGDFTPFRRQLAKEGRNLSRRIDLKIDSRGIRSFDKDLLNVNRSLNITDKNLNRTSRSGRRFAGSVAGVNAQMALLRNVFRIIKWPAVVAGLGAVAQAASAAGAGLVSMTSALAPLTGLVATAPAGLLGLAQAIGAVKLATAGVGAALQDMNTAQVRAGKNAVDTANKQRQAADAARQSAEAQRAAALAVEEAERNLIDAHRDERTAQQDLSAARKEAADTLIDLKFAAEEAANSEVDAQRALKQAQHQQEIINRQANATFQQRQDAATAVRDAELQLREARVEDQRAQDAATQAEERGIKGSQEVTSAQRAKADAQRASTEAARALAEAQRDQTRAAQDAARQEKDSARDLADLNTEAQNLQYTMSQLPESGQHFVHFLFDLKPVLDDLREITADGILPGAEKGITAAMENLPELKDVLDATARSFGNIAEEAGQFLGRDGFGRDFARIGKANAGRFEDLADAGLDFADAVRHIAVAAEPLTDFLTDQVGEFGEWAKESAKAGRRSGEMADFFKETKDVFKDVVDIGSDLAEVLINIGKASFPTGQNLLDELVDATDDLKDWTESEGGKKSLQKYFEDAQPAIEETGRLVADFTTEFFDMADNPDLVEFIRVIRVDLLPLLFDITTKLTNELGPELIELFVEFSKTMDEVGTPALTTFIDLVTSALGLVNDLFTSIPGLASAAAASLAGFSLIRLLGFGPDRRSLISSAIKGTGKLIAEMFGIELASAEAATAWQNAGSLIQSRLRGALKIGIAGALAGIGIANIVSDVTEGDWRSAGFSAAGALVGGIAGFLAGGGPLGAAAGAGIGAQIGKLISDSWEDIVNATANIKTLPFVESIKASFDQVGIDTDKQLRRLIRNSKGTEEAINKHIIQQWVAAGDITVQEAGVMIEQLKAVNQEAAKVARDTAERTGVNMAESIAADGKVTSEELQKTFSELEALKPKARETALETFTNWSQVLKNMGDISATEFQQLLDNTEDKFGNIDNTIKGHSKDAANALRDNFKNAFDQAKDGSRDLKDHIDKDFSSINSIMGTQTSKGADDVDRNMDRAKTQGSQSAHALDLNVGGSVHNLAQEVYKGFKNIGDNTIDALKNLKVKKQPNFGIKPPSSQEVQALHELKVGGSLVPGNMPGDRHTLSLNGMPIAKVESGETINVMNKTASAAAMAWNRMIPRMADGGWLGTVGGVQLDKRIIPDARALQAKYNLVFSQGYTPAFSGGPSSDYGEHPLGLALDIVPPGNDWSQVTALAHYAEPTQGSPIHPWRWVGYDGDAGHGEGNHLHLSWAHTGGLPPPVPSVETMGGKVLSAIGGAVVEKLKRVILEGPDTPWKAAGQASLDLGTKAANAYLSKISGPVVPEVGGFGKPVKPGQGTPLGKFMASSYGPPWGGIQGTGVTATGVDLTASPHIYGVAVDPSVIALGSKLGIQPNPFGTDNAFKAFDTGGAILGNRIDFYDWRGRDEQLGWGMRSVNVSKLMDGGVLGRPLPKKLQKYNHLWAPHKSPDYGGPTMPEDMIAMGLEYFGFPGWTGVEISKGESGKRPGAWSVDPAPTPGIGTTKGYGLMAITSPFGDEFGVKNLGGYKQMLNPLKNMVVAGKMYKAGGLQPWHGTQFLVHENKHWQGDFGELTSAAHPENEHGDHGDRQGQDNADDEDKPEHDHLSKKTRKLLEKIRNLRTKTISLDEQIANQQILDAFSTSPGGTELSEGERLFEIDLNQKLLRTLIRHRDLIDLVLPDLSGGNKRATLMKELEALEGVTGEGGRILQTQAEIDRLRQTDPSVSSEFDWAQFIELLSEKLAASVAENYLLRAQMPVFQRFHDGGVVQGPPGMEMPAWLLPGERVLREDQQVGGVTVIVEDGAVDAQRIRVIANDELSRQVRSAQRHTVIAGQGTGVRQGPGVSPRR